jgi:hypothetical protein
MLTAKKIASAGNGGNRIPRIHPFTNFADPARKDCVDLILVVHPFTRRTCEKFYL